MEQINLNLIPSGVTPICHASQYDDKRKIRLNLFNGANAFTITNDMTFELQARKPDDHVITASVTGTADNTYIDIETTQQLTACFGDVICQISISDSSDDSTIGTLNFILNVEQDVLADGDPSASVIEDLPSLIDEYLDPYKYWDYEDSLSIGETELDITVINPPFNPADYSYLYFVSVPGYNPISVESFQTFNPSTQHFKFTFEEPYNEDVWVKVRVYRNYRGE